MVLQVNNLRVEAVKRIADFFASLKSRVTETPTPSEAVDLTTISQPETIQVFRQLIKAIALADNDSRVINEFLKFADLLKAGHVDVKVSKQDDTHFTQKYYLADKDQPLIKFSYQYDNTGLNPTKLEVQAEQDGIYISPVNLKAVFSQDKNIFQSVFKAVGLNHQNYRYVNEFINSPTKSQATNNTGTWIAAPRPMGKTPAYLVASLDSTGTKVNFGKSNGSSGPITEEIKLGALAQTEIIQSIQTLLKPASTTPEAATANSELPKIDLKLIAEAAEIEIKAKAKISSAAAAAATREMAAKRSAQASGTPAVKAPFHNAQPASWRSELSLDELNKVKEAEAQKQSLIQSLKTTLKQNTKLESRIHSEEVRGILGPEQREVKSIAINVATASGPLELHINAIIGKNNIEVKEISIPNLSDGLDKKTKPLPIDLRASMSDETLSEILPIAKDQLAKFFAQEHEKFITEFSQLLIPDEEIKIIHPEKDENIGFGVINTTPSGSFVFELDMKQKQIVSLEKSAIQPKLNAKTLSSLIYYASNYTYGKPGGGNEAFNGGGVPLLHLNLNSRQIINDKLSKVRLTAI